MNNKFQFFIYCLLCFGNFIFPNTAINAYSDSKNDSYKTKIEIEELFSTKEVENFSNSDQLFISREKKFSKNLIEKDYKNCIAEGEVIRAKYEYSKIFFLFFGICYLGVGNYEAGKSSLIKSISIDETYTPALALKMYVDYIVENLYIDKKQIQYLMLHFQDDYLSLSFSFNTLFQFSTNEKIFLPEVIKIAQFFIYKFPDQISTYNDIIIYLDKFNKIDDYRSFFYEVSKAYLNLRVELDKDALRAIIYNMRHNAIIGKPTNKNIKENEWFIEKIISHMAINDDEMLNMIISYYWVLIRNHGIPLCTIALKYANKANTSYYEHNLNDSMIISGLFYSCKEYDKASEYFDNVYSTEVLQVPDQIVNEMIYATYLSDREKKDNMTKYKKVTSIYGKYKSVKLSELAKLMVSVSYSILKLSNEALTIYNNISDVALVEYLYLSRIIPAAEYEYQKNYEKAIELTERLLNLCKKANVNEDYEIAHLYRVLGLSKYALQSYEESKKYLLLSVKNNINTRDVYSCLSEIYAKEGDSQKSKFFSEKGQALR